MNILILVFNIGIPILMIFIGILYKHNLYKKIDKISELIMPVAMFFNGLSDDNLFSTDTNALYSYNKRCSLIWSVLGILTLLLTIALLILNRSNIYTISIAILEFQCLILVAVFVSIEYFLKKK